LSGPAGCYDAHRCVLCEFLGQVRDEATRGFASVTADRERRGHEDDGRRVHRWLPGQRALPAWEARSACKSRLWVSDVICADTSPIRNTIPAALSINRLMSVKRRCVVKVKA